MTPEAKARVNIDKMLAEAGGRKGGTGHAAASPAVRIADVKTVVACHKVLSGGDIARGSAHGGYGVA